MSWNKVIDNVNKETRWRLQNSGTFSESQGIIIVDLCLVLGADGIPMLWTVESKRVQPGHKAKEAILALPNPIDILSQI